jgi:hypothetical protein
MSVTDERGHCIKQDQFSGRWHIKQNYPKQSQYLIIKKKNDKIQNLFTRKHEEFSTTTNPFSMAVEVHQCTVNEKAGLHHGPVIKILMYINVCLE